jgi:hypothetical protein
VKDIAVVADLTQRRPALCAESVYRARGTIELVATGQINLSDPDFEPSDEQLRALSRGAFADVRQKNAEAAARLTAAIEERRRAVLARIAPLLASGGRQNR